MSHILHVLFQGEAIWASFIFFTCEMEIKIRPIPHWIFVRIKGVNIRKALTRVLGT